LEDGDPKNMKKIIFIIPNLNGGGAERVAINYMRQLEQKNYSVILIVFDLTADLKGVIPSNVIVINLSTKSTKRSFLPLLKQLRHSKPDIVFTTHSRVAALLLIMKPFMSDFLHIARMPNMPSLERKYSVYSNITRYFFTLSFKSANIVIAQTDDMKVDALKIFHLNEKQVIVQNNPIDIDYIDDMLKDSVSPFANDRIIAIASGRLSFQKGFDILIKAISEIIKKYPNFILYILGGDDGEGERLKQLINDLQLEKQVAFLGFVENPYPYYRFCDLFILSSRWEGFPNVIIENYYLNTPIATTSCVPIIRKLIANGKNGFLSEIDNHLALAEAIINTLQIKRQNISNPPYQYGNITDLIEG
jgi:glycosyltransferase involved in cell wall biosynthesis